MGGNRYCLGKDVQRGLIMWPPPQGEVGGAKSASCHQSNCEISRHAAQIYDHNRRRLPRTLGLVEHRHVSRGIRSRRTKACLQDALIIYAVGMVT